MQTHSVFRHVLYVKPLRCWVMWTVRIGDRLWMGSLHLCSCSKTCNGWREPVFGTKDREAEVGWFNSNQFKRQVLDTVVC